VADPGDLTIWRHEVPIDDQWHLVACGRVLHVDARTSGVVEFWALHWTPTVDRPLPPAREFRVFGTGHPLPGHHLGHKVNHVGSVAIGPFVWHLMETALNLSARLDGTHP
jgi:hypothetical protein